MKNLLILLSILSFLACNDRNPDTPDSPVDPVLASLSDSDRNMNVGLQTVALPAALDEISGHTVLNDSTILCVEDENGLVYFVNPKTHKVNRTISFGDVGDYEGIAVKGNKIYIMRSDGVIFITGTESTGKEKAKSVALPYDHLDMEGLAFDPETGDLLAVAKSAGKDFDGKVPVFRFSTSSEKFLDKPFVLIKEDMDESSKGKGKKDRKKEKFSPSEMAIHPVRKTLITLDSPSSMWRELSRTGELISSFRLNEKILPQPEGLAYDSQGNIWISSEGRGKGAVLIQLREDQLSSIEK